MRAIWKGAISFGLVNIPVALHTATRREELKFRLLRKSDMSPVNYKRVAEADGKEVPWDEIVKGYEYEKGRFVMIRDEDFKRVDVEATQTIEITDFVDMSEVNPIFFAKPYYIEPGKHGSRPFVLLRETLRQTGKIGIAKVVIKTREHLAAVKPNGKVLVLELMHFADEIVEPDEIKHPDADVGKKEIEMAKTLVSNMTSKWEPEKYKDTYREAMMHVIEQKVESGGKALPAPKTKAKQPTNVIDLMTVLQESIAKAGGGKKRPRAKRSRATGKKKPKAA